MKRAALGLAALLLLAGSALSFAACDDLFESESENGIYYLYEDGELNKSASITLNDGEWTYSGEPYFPGTLYYSGRYTISDGLNINYTVAVKELFGLYVTYGSGRIFSGGLEFYGKSYFIEGEQREYVFGF